MISRSRSPEKYPGQMMTMMQASEKLRVAGGPLNGSAHGPQIVSTERCDIDLISVGAFGRAVAGRLRSYASGLHEFGDSSSWNLKEITLRDPPGNGALIVAAPHPAPALCESLARLAHEKGRPFLPVVIDESILRLGPIIVPGFAGCWRCWVDRYRQHDTHPRETEALHSFYNNHPESGPRGYLEPFAWIVAAQLLAILDSRLSLEQWAGKLWQVDLFSREVTTGELIGVDGCGCCGLNRPLRSRTYSDMQKSLAYLWNQSLNPDLEELTDSHVKAHSACKGERK